MVRKSQKRIRVALGRRREESAGSTMALGLRPDAAAIAQFVADTGAHHVHIRVAPGSLLQQAGTLELIDRLSAVGTLAQVFGRPEQLSLFR